MGIWTIISEVIFFLILYENMESIKVKWLEQLGYGAESRCKVVSSRLGFAICDDWKTLSVNRAVKWVPLSNHGRIRQQKKRDGSAFLQLSPRYSGTLTPLPLRL